MRSELNTWRITRGRNDWGLRVASDDSESADILAAPESKLLVGRLGGGSGSVSLNRAGNCLECTAHPEFPGALRLLSGTDPDSPENGGFLSVTAVGMLPWGLWMEQSSRGDSTRDSSCWIPSWGLVPGAVGLITDSST